MQINQLPVFVTIQELDPVTSPALNMRFVGFLHKLAVRYQLHEPSLLRDSQEILGDAGIRQNLLITDPDLTGPCDLSVFNLDND